MKPAGPERIAERAVAALVLDVLRKLRDQHPQTSEVRALYDDACRHVGVLVSRLARS